MIIECPSCNSKVDGKVLAEYERMRDDGPAKYVFLVCPVCDMAIVGFTECYQISSEEVAWTIAERCWPDPKRTVSGIVPEIISKSIEQAEKCFRIGAYDACAVMCGRAIEGICKEHVGKKGLAEGLRELKAKNIIDARLHDWAESLRAERNIGAHATDIEISKEDARDILDFAQAIIDYVYELTIRHERYKKRKLNKKSLELKTEKKAI